MEIREKGSEILREELLKAQKVLLFGMHLLASPVMIITINPDNRALIIGNRDENDKSGELRISSILRHLNICKLLQIHTWSPFYLYVLDSGGHS